MNLPGLRAWRFDVPTPWYVRAFARCELAVRYALWRVRR